MLLTDWNSNAYRQENDLYGGIGYYRVVKPAQFLREWFDIEVVGADIRNWGTTDEKYTRIGKNYDLIFSKHIDNGEAASNLLATADHYKKNVIVDIDDNYMDIRKDNPAYKDYAELKGGRYFLSALLSLCDNIAVSTKPLKSAYSRLNSEIEVLPNCNDVNDWTHPIKVHDDGKIRIGYQGGNAHWDDLMLIAEPMARILDKYDHVLFQIIGALDALQARKLGEEMMKYSKRDITPQIQITGGTLAWEGYPEFLASQGWDIGIAPLVDDVFSRGKSHIKVMEYAMVGAACIASKVYPYSEPIMGVPIMEHGKHGYFATNTEEWQVYLEKLILDPKLRSKLSTAMYKHVKAKWQWKHWIHLWKDLFERYIK